MLWNKWCKDYYRHFDPFDLFVFQVELPKQRRHSFVICVRYPLWRNKYRLRLLRPPNQYSSPSLKISSQEWVSTNVSPVVACLRWVGSTLCFDGTMVSHFHSFHSVPILFVFFKLSTFTFSVFTPLIFPILHFVKYPVFPEDCSPSLCCLIAPVSVCCHVTLIWSVCNVWCQVIWRTIYW